MECKTVNIKELVKNMTLEEKASMCSGKDFWHLKSVERLGIPEIMVTDGPHGLRKQEGASDHLGLNASLSSTCFPSGATLANSWNRDMVNRVGMALGKECQAEHVGILLGPAMNIKRTPLCGRNFEYFSEDPYLTGEIASAHIKGVQSQGIGTCVKHFAANNQEYRRFSMNALIDERTLREIYLAAFEKVVKQAKPMSMMAAFNKVNGTNCCENRYLLKDVLKDEWNYKGFVMTDWAAMTDRVASLYAGLDLEMPGSGGDNDRKIAKAVEEGKISEEVLDDTVERIVSAVMYVTENYCENATYSVEEHHDIAYQAAAESVVMLKNKDDILPLAMDAEIAVIGEFAEKTRYQGGGSSHINPTKLEKGTDCLKQSGFHVEYAQGFEIDAVESNEEMVQEAVKLAARKENVIFYMGLPDSFESESFDRKDLQLPQNQVELLDELYKVNKNIIVVLAAGSPVVMPWLSKVKAVLDGYLSGQAGALAMADIISGKINPSGKLAETFPMKLEYNPAYLNYPGEQDEVKYQEGIFVGYRYYEKKKLPVQFPFGYGLSYTSFAYSDMEIVENQIESGGCVGIKLKVKNTGKYAGAEIVQLYVAPIEDGHNRPVRELKGFQKVFLKPQEEADIYFELEERDFSIYNVRKKGWEVISGKYEILAAASSEDVRQKQELLICSEKEEFEELTLASTIEELMHYEEGIKLGLKLGSVIIEDLPDAETLSDEKIISEGMGFDVAAMIGDLQLKMLVLFSNGAIQMEKVQEELDIINSKIKKRMA